MSRVAAMSTSYTRPGIEVRHPSQVDIGSGTLVDRAWVQHGLCLGALFTKTPRRGERHADSVRRKAGSARSSAEGPAVPNHLAAILGDPAGLLRALGNRPHTMEPGIAGEHDERRCLAEKFHDVVRVSLGIQAL